MKAIHVPALTGLRFVAAMMVLIGHGWSVSRFNGDTVTGRFLNPLPSMGMTLFFVLSGFVMWVNYAESFRERLWPSLWRFAVARFARLYPLFLAVGLFALIVTNWANLPNELPDALLFIPLLQAWIPGSIPSSGVFAIPELAHAWSISVEMFLYMCFPAIALLMLAVRSRRVLLGFALLNVAICFVGIWLYINNMSEVAAYLARGMPLPAANMWIGYYSPITRINEFIAGCIAGAMISRPRTGDAPGWHGLVLIACLAGLVFIAALYSTPIGLSHATLTSIQRAGPLVCFAYLVWFLARGDSRVGRVLSAPAILFGGEISYSIYLVHPYILPWFRRPDMDFSATHFGLWVGVMVVAIAAVIIMSYGTYSLIEVPCRRWLRAALISTRPNPELTVVDAAELSFPAPMR